MKTLAWQKRSQCTPGISSSRGSTPNSPSKDSYRTFILNSLQNPRAWDSPRIGRALDSRRVVSPHKVAPPRL
nr:MAG: ORF3 [Torque teno polar bear virus 1]